MKKVAFIFCFIVLGWGFAHGQDDDTDGGDGIKLRKGMRLYMQKRLELTDAEAEKLEPVLGRYLQELRKAHRENEDPMVRQQKKADIRLRYRNEFKPIMGEKRANRFFLEEPGFRKFVREELIKRRQKQGGAGTRELKRPPKRFRE